MNKFDLKELYQKAFGISGIKFSIPPSENIAISAIKTATFSAGQFANDEFRKTSQPDYYSGIETLPLPVANMRSVLGTPIYEQINLSLPGGALDYTFPDWPLFDITGQDIIIKTIMMKKKGSVKEFISEDDYNIRIRGILINYETQEYPEKQLQDLMQVIKSKEPLLIKSQVFNLLDIYSIYIVRHSFPSVEGYQNIQPFELECISDVPAILEIKSTKTRLPIVAGMPSNRQ
ncbi:DUF6046 domain-containing protein [Mucilaginibacter sp.]|uniref:DUF6046 domain-containing protein n=1 Tax=Mucilaginibacter sp. TaxID=1882438 RepID=UPI0025DF3093|nr:DUF6046 domain-containing protein [Mucilaginibacter sp.]